MYVTVIERGGFLGNIDRLNLAKLLINVLLLTFYNIRNIPSVLPYLCPDLKISVMEVDM